MKPWPERKALGAAACAGALVLGGALLGAGAIRVFPGMEATRGTATESGVAAPPASSAVLVEQGHEFFEMSCSQCHGDDARGDEGPDLHNLAISDARIGTTIRKGIKGEMPSFAKKYGDREVAALVAYLRRLR